MNIWQRSHREHREEGPELDARISASRAEYIAQHDATFDYEAGWADIVARAGLAAPDEDRLDAVTDTAPDADPIELSPAVAGPGEGPRHRSGRRMILAGAACIAAAAVLLAGIVVLGPDHGGDSDGTEPGLATRIITATEEALATLVEHEVSYMSDTPAQPYMEVWADKATSNHRILHHAPDGRGPSLEMGPDTPPNPDGNPSGGSRLVRWVDHCREEYTVEEESFRPGIDDQNTTSAEQVLDGLSNGLSRPDGTEVVDGQELIRVVDDGDMTESVWYVDPETYRPVRYVVPPDDNGEGVVTTIEYLPRTPELLAQFTPVIPDGFTEVDESTRVDPDRPYIEGCG